MRLILFHLILVTLCVANSYAWAQGASPAGGGKLTLTGSRMLATEDSNAFDRVLKEAYTIEAWLYLKDFPPGDEQWTIVAKPGSYEWSIVGTKHPYARGARYSFFFMVGTGVGAGSIMYGMNPKDSNRDIRNAWHHIALMGESPRYSMSFNGNINTGGPFIPIPDSNSKLYVGGNPTRQNSHFRGYIDELRISTVKRYQNNFDLPKGDFQADDKTNALWHFNGEQMFRDSAHGYTLIWSSFAVVPADKLTTTWGGIKVR